MEDSFVRCRVDFARYPQNLPFSGCSSSKIASYCKTLDELEPDLFDEEDHSIEFHDNYHGTLNFHQNTASSTAEVSVLCPLDQPSQLACRFVSVYSSNTRNPLYTSRSMLSMVLSFHLVRPHFLDFLFIYGDQLEPRDPFFTSFRACQLSPENRQGLVVPSLNRSGHELNICYNLRAPERSTGNRHMPWSVRPAVLYHSLDIMSGQCFWLSLKGNESMGKELAQEGEKLQWTSTDASQTALKAFSSALRMQIVFCEWSRGNWRTYTKYLADELDGFTKTLVTKEFQERPMPTKGEMQAFPPHRSRTLSILRRFSYKPVTTRAPQSSDFQGVRENSNSNTLKTKPTTEKDGEYNEEIKLPSLQSTQHLEEQVRDAKFYLQGNIKNVKGVIAFYRNLRNLTDEMRCELEGFESELNDIVYDLEMHFTSLDNLLQLTGKRKALLFSVLDHQNKKASEYFATKAQLSAMRMEEISEDMREMTRKTKRETVSMKILAGVTVFYLPGTFVSALMNTAIIQFTPSGDGKYIRQSAPGAWSLFLELTLPLMLVTFGAWLLTSWWSNRENSDNDSPTPAA